MTRLVRRVERLARRGGGERGPLVVAFPDAWPAEGRAAYERAIAAGDLRAQEDLLARHHGVRPRLAFPDGRPLPEDVRSLVVRVGVRPAGPQ